MSNSKSQIWAVKQMFFNGFNQHFTSLNWSVLALSLITTILNPVHFYIMWSVHFRMVNIIITTTPWNKFGQVNGFFPVAGVVTWIQDTNWRCNYFGHKVQMKGSDKKIRDFFIVFLYKCAYMSFVNVFMITFYSWGKNEQITFSAVSMLLYLQISRYMYEGAISFTTFPCCLIQQNLSQRQSMFEVLVIPFIIFCSWQNIA